MGEINIFQSFKIFDDNIINQKIDEIYNLLISNFGDINGKFAVCGSIAKILDGKFSEEYTAKDIDLLCRDSIFWRFLTANHIKIKTQKTEIEESRIKLFYKEGFLIEIWKEKIPFVKEGIYKEKIEYCYGN